MEIKIIEERENPILNRREVKFVVEHDGPTPSRKSVIDKIAATMNSKVGLVMVDSLKSEFGKRETMGYAKIYESEERAKEVERAYVVARNVPAPAAGTEE
ncbi:30S ribosomal protein S24e [Methanotrichaceae archaeon M04Ac]|uniref:Small ribosomal subunit protein eS24 n=1 Tax=Candidatus Methanocrinis alkalitolerans TaxID=3033395 RepID=A0ABT5XDB4_9EURY|nr:30S ribosomal protein S24e [Candidatus Methanocrinis alkalitolerans]MDF0592699.1 30S ribosomal protein S24e [Candidatus Methanocrinis alkalitolerans]